MIACTLTALLAACGSPSLPDGPAPSGGPTNAASTGSPFPVTDGKGICPSLEDRELWLAEHPPARIPDDFRFDRLVWCRELLRAPEEGDYRQLETAVDPPFWRTLLAEAPPRVEPPCAEWLQYEEVMVLVDTRTRSALRVHLERDRCNHYSPQLNQLLDDGQRWTLSTDQPG
ncbi:hypothetical protein CLV29_1645 [Naumannella halotolerans]|uniref:Uncharacterized protein n=1 Tax=Naumannella halotolerans TaxID=993414 RepID=A0A4R7J915_9ACTN|nr:hypothetical protein CLV29_1645 [Naumannella halotolerans]